MRLLTLLALLLTLTACAAGRDNGVTAVGTATTTAAPAANGTPLTTPPTQMPAATATTAGPTPTAPPAGLRQRPAGWPILNSDPWTFVDPQDPTIPPLIVPDGEKFKVDTTATVALSPGNSELTPLDDYWAVSCPTAVNGNERYDFQVEATFRDDAGAAIVVTGRLFGAGHENPIFTQPLPAPLADSFAQNPNAAAILADHQMILRLSSVDIDPLAPESGVYAGEAVFVGATPWQGRQQAYSISTPFIVENGTLTAFSLTPAIIDDVFAQVASQSLTANALAADSGLSLNLWYGPASGVESADGSSGSGGFGAFVLRCGTAVPGAYLPGPEQPFIAFDFNRTPYWGLGRSTFVLQENEVNIVELRLNSYGQPAIWSQRDQVILALMPEPIQAFLPSLVSMSLFQASRPNHWVLRLTPTDAAAPTIADDPFWDTIPGERDPQMLSFDNVKLAVTADGWLEFVSCAEE